MDDAEVGTGIQYDANEIFGSAAALAARGWKVVKIYGLHDDLSCTCARGKSCPSAGKHPVENEWQTTATDDENTIAGWFENTNVRWNIGVRLGASSGIIDVEADDDNALRVMQEYGLDKIDTTAYQGSRGPHFLFQYEAGLPEAGVVKVGWLEVRIGGGEKGTQSVFPGSWHKTGVQYKWLPGRSPDEVLPARLPAAFKDAILAKAGSQKSSGCVKDAREALAGEEKIREGGRHRFLLGEASEQFILRKHALNEDTKKRVLTILRSLNSTKCDPPKDDAEVVKIVDDQFRFFQGEAEQARQAQMSPLERAGLRKNNDLWEPGDWRAVRVHSDPVRYRLAVPGGPNNNPFRVNLTADDWTTPKKVAQKFLAATGRNLQDPTPTAWAGVWSGCKFKDDGNQWQEQRGLAVQLLEGEFVSDEYPAPELSRKATVACLLYNRLMSEKKPTDTKATAPHPSGSAKWIFVDGRLELWFHWVTVWTEINESAETPVTASEKHDLQEDLLRRLGLNDFPIRQWGPDRKRYLRFVDPYLDALAAIAGLEATP